MSFVSLSLAVIFNWNYNNRCRRTSQQDNNNKSSLNCCQLTVGFHQGEWRLEQESSKIHWTRVIGWRDDNTDNYVEKAQLIKLYVESSQYEIAYLWFILSHL